MLEHSSTLESLHIIAQMIRLFPDMPAAKDGLDRTPLHVAAGSKASASLLKLLAHACPAARDVLFILVDYQVQLDSC